jgi:hypothetical protein
MTFFAKKTFAVLQHLGAKMDRWKDSQWPAPRCRDALCRSLPAATRLSEVRAAVDRIGGFLGEGSVPLACERDLSLPGPHGQVPSRLYLPNGNLSATWRMRAVACDQPAASPPHLAICRPRSNC